MKVWACAETDGSRNSETRADTLGGTLCQRLKDITARPAAANARNVTLRFLTEIGFSICRRSRTMAWEVKEFSEWIGWGEKSAANKTSNTKLTIRKAGRFTGTSCLL